MEAEIVFHSIVLAVITAIVAINTAYFFSTHSRQSFLFILLSSLSFAVLVMIYRYQERVPSMIGITLSNLMMMNTIAFIGIAHHLILEDIFPTAFYASVLTASLILFVFEGIFFTPYVVRFFITAAATLTVLVKHSLLIRRNMRKIGLPITLVLVLSCLGMASLVVLGAVNALNDATSSRFFVESTVFPFLLVLFISFFVLMQSSSYILFSRIQYIETYAALENAANERDFSRTVLSLVGHDVRGPLATAKQSLELMSQNEENAADGFFELLKASIYKALNILDDLLLWSKERAGDLFLKPEKVELAALVDSLLVLTGHDSATKGLVLDVDVEKGLFVSADGTALAAVLRNIIGNAIKFSRQGGRMAIEAHIDGAGGVVTITVRDFGIGMTEENLRRFREGSFQESRVGTKSESGLGLGLMLISNICRRAGWTIEIGSQKGEGTTAILCLPASGGSTVR